MNERYYNVKELQEILHLSERTIFRLVNRGELAGFKVGREWRFTQADIEAYIDLQRRKAESERRKKAQNQAPIEGEAQPLVCSLPAA